MSGTIEILYDDGKLHSHVELAGEFTGWQAVPLGLDKGTRYAAFFDGANPGQKYMYKFIVEGHWTLHPAYSTVTDESGFVNHTVVAAYTQPPASQHASPSKGSTTQQNNDTFSSTRAESSKGSASHAATVPGTGLNVDDTAHGANSYGGHQQNQGVGYSSQGGYTSQSDSTYLGTRTIPGTELGVNDAIRGGSYSGREQVSGGNSGNNNNTSNSDWSQQTVPGTGLRVDDAAHGGASRGVQQHSGFQPTTGYGLSDAEGYKNQTFSSGSQTVPGTGLSVNDATQSGSYADRNQFSNSYGADNNTTYSGQQYSSSVTVPGTGLRIDDTAHGLASQEPPQSSHFNQPQVEDTGNKVGATGAAGILSGGPEPYEYSSSQLEKPVERVEGLDQINTRAAAGVTGLSRSGDHQRYEYSGSQLETPVEKIEGLEQVHTGAAATEVTSGSSQPYEYNGSQLDKQVERVDGLDQIKSIGKSAGAGATSASGQAPSHPYEYKDSQLSNATEKVEGIEKILGDSNKSKTAKGNEPSRENLSDLIGNKPLNDDYPTNMPGSLPYEERLTGHVPPQQVTDSTLKALGGDSDTKTLDANSGYLDKKVEEFKLEDNADRSLEPVSSGGVYNRSYTNSVEDQNYESATENFDDSEILAAAISGAALGKKTGAFPVSSSDRTISNNLDNTTGAVHGSDLDIDAARRAVEATESTAFEADDPELNDALGNTGLGATERPVLDTEPVAYTTVDSTTSWTAPHQPEEGSRGKTERGHSAERQLAEDRFVSQYVDYEPEEQSPSVSRSSFQGSPYGSVRTTPSRRPQHHQTIDVSTGFPIDQEYESYSPSYHSQRQRPGIGAAPTLRQGSTKRRSVQTGVPGTSIIPGYPSSTENRNAAVIAAAAKASAFAKQDVAAISNPPPPPGANYQPQARNEGSPRRRPMSQSFFSRPRGSPRGPASSSGGTVGAPTSAGSAGSVGGASLGGATGLTRSNTTGGISNSLYAPGSQGNSAVQNGLPSASSQVAGTNTLPAADSSTLRAVSSFDRDQPVAQLERAESRREGKFKRFMRKLSAK